MLPNCRDFIRQAIGNDPNDVIFHRWVNSKFNELTSVQLILCLGLHAEVNNHQ